MTTQDPKRVWVTQLSDRMLQVKKHETTKITVEVSECEDDAGSMAEPPVEYELRRIKPVWEPEPGDTVQRNHYGTQQNASRPFVVLEMQDEGYWLLDPDGESVAGVDVVRYFEPSDLTLTDEQVQVLTRWAGAIRVLGTTEATESEELCPGSHMDGHTTSVSFQCINCQHLNDGLFMPNHIPRTTKGGNQ